MKTREIFAIGYQVNQAGIKKKWLSGYISWGKIGPAERLENKRNENV